MNNPRFQPVSFASLSPTSTTFFTRTLDMVTGKFTRPRIKLADGTEIDAEPPVFVKHQGGLSSKGARNLRKSVNALLMGVDENILIDGKGKENITFATLTLASSQIKRFGAISADYFATDKEIKRECFNQLITEIKQQYGQTEFVWVTEKQLNASLHFHVLFDKRIEWQWLRSRWNSLQNKFGFIDRYAEKMRKLSKEQYFELRKSECKNITPKKLEQWEKAWNYGVQTNWTDPNSTDIQTLKKVKNVAGYISKYMSKGAEFEDKKSKEYIAKISAQYDITPEGIKNLYTIDGRIWQCSQKISKARKCIAYLEPEFMPEMTKLIEHQKEPKIFEEDHFVTILHSFKQLKEYANKIFLALTSHVKAVFTAVDSDYFITAISSNSFLSPVVRSYKQMSLFS